MRERLTEDSKRSGAPVGDSGWTGCTDGGVKTRGARDVIIWRIRAKVPQGANCLSFRFKFLSGNQSPTISAPNDFATASTTRPSSSTACWFTIRITASHAWSTASPVPRSAVRRRLSRRLGRRGLPRLLVQVHESRIENLDRTPGRVVQVDSARGQTCSRDTHRDQFLTGLREGMTQRYFRERQTPCRCKTRRTAAQSVFIP